MHAAAPPSIVDRVHAGIDDILAADLDALGDRAQCDEVVEHHRAEARLPAALFAKVLAYWLQHADPDGTEDDAEARRERRDLYVSRTLDGSVAIDGVLDPADGAVSTPRCGGLTKSSSRPTGARHRTAWDGI